MFVFLANNKEFTCPQSLKDITLAQYLEYEEVKKCTPLAMATAARLLQDLETELSEADRAAKLAELAKIEKACTVGKHKKETTKFKIKVVAIFTGLTEDEMLGREGINIDSLNELYSAIILAIDYNNHIEFTNHVNFKGVDYYVSSSENLTLGEFLEVAQVEELFISLRKNESEAYLGVISVLLRKANEPFSEQVYERNKENFINLDMDTVLSVCFFLSKKNMRYISDVNVFSALQTVAETMIQRAKLLDGLSGM